MNRQPFLTNFLINLVFILGMLGLFLSVKFILKQKFFSLITTKQKLNYTKIGLTFLFWILFSFIFTMYDSFRGGVIISSNMDLYSNWAAYLFIPLSIVLTLVQTAFEELFVCSFLAQFFSRKFNNLIVLCLTTAISGLLHFANPENALGWLISLYYFVIGGFLGVISYIDDGLETAIAFHWANNWFNTIIFGMVGGVLPLTSFAKLESYKFGWVDLIVFTLAMAIIAYVFQLLKKKYPKLLA